MLKSIEIDFLTKVYGRNQQPALNGFSVSIAKGEIFGLLGPNGAGKTTLISLITGILKPDSGEIKLFGKPVADLSTVEKLKISLVPQEIALYPSLTCIENLKFFAQMSKKGGKSLNEQISYLSKKLELQDFLNKKVSSCSGGMKRRINLASALLNDPELLILDEPTVGIDVYSKNAILSFLEQLKEKGTTIFYTSHQLEEAERICDSIAIIKKGKLLWYGKKSSYSGTDKDFTQNFLDLTAEE